MALALEYLLRYQWINVFAQFAWTYVNPDCGFEWAIECQILILPYDIKSTIHFWFIKSPEVCVEQIQDLV